MSLNKEKSQIGIAKGAVTSISSTLTDKKKAAIILLLNEIAHSNNHMNSNEQKIMSHVLQFIGAISPKDMNQKGQEVLKNLVNNMGLEEAFQVLSNVDEWHKREILIWLAAMTSSDSPDQRSYGIFDRMAKEMGIEVNQFVSTEKDTIIAFLNK